MRPWITLARKRLALRDERGIALVMAIGIMFVLTITVSSVMVYTAAGARHANHSNAGQKAYALAEAGVNDAMAVLKPTTPTRPTLPGRPRVAARAADAYEGGSCTAPVNNCVNWCGTLAVRRPSSPWRWEWRITSTGTVENPTGPGAAPVTRKATAIVPVVIPTDDAGGATGPLNFLYRAPT